MANQRIYNSYDRTKLARNKYGVINNYSTLGTTAYYNDNPVGGTMVDLKDFRGATRTEDGVRGIVPAPLAGMNTWFLQGSGGWVRIPAFDWITDFPESDGLEKTGIQVNGDLNVTDTITTMNLEVQGAAHFWSLIIDEVKAQGGQVLVSPSMFKVDYVGKVVSYNIFEQNSPLIELIAARTDIYNILKANNVEAVRCRRLYQRCDDGKMAIENECQIGDMMRCRQFNIKPGEYRNISNTDYWSFVCNTGEEPYTDEDGNTYEAFFIDLAFTLRKEDGHNIPLGSKLYLDGRDPDLPSGFVEITDALELKRVSQETWDGTRSVDDEFFENEEWTSIQETVIKVRGLDDQVQDITGKAANNNLYDNDKYLQKAKDYLDIALNGGTVDDTDSTNAFGRMSTLDATSMVLFGMPSDDISNEPDGLLLKQAEKGVSAILGNTASQNMSYGLSIGTTKFNKITLAENTRIEREFIVVDEVKDYIDGQEQVIYHPGQVLTPGTEITHDLNVVDIKEETDIKEFNPSTPTILTPVTPEVENVVNTHTEDTQTGINRDYNEWEKIDVSEVTEWQFGYVGYYPNFRIKSGDALACLGHLYNVDRQNAIVLSSTNPIDPELEAPAMAQYSHIGIFGESISKFRQTAIAANGNEFIGSFLVNYNDTYLDINEKINMMIMDIETGLENVGIHLDGENSTITLVGSIDLRQHSQDSYDTLNLYDNIGIKRVEITPFDIPKRGDPGSQIVNGKYVFNTINENKTAPSAYIDYDTSMWNWIPNWLGNTDHYYYTLKNFIITLTTSVNIGYLDAGYELDLRDLQLKLNMPAYFVGSDHVTNRGWNDQEITSFTYSLKKDGVAQPINGKTIIPITGFQTSGIDTESVTLFQSLVLDNYDVKQSGTYTVEVNLGVKVYGYIDRTKGANNPYFTFRCNLSGSLSTTMNRIQQNDVAYDGHKLTIGTNGFELVIDNDKHLYAADDAIELQWGSNYITLDSTRGMYIRKDVIEVENGIVKHGNDVISRTGQLGITSEIVFCRISTTNSYTITLPDPTEFGLFRTITILGWINEVSRGVPITQLTVQTKGNSYIEIQYLIPDAGTRKVDFGSGTGQPTQALTLMATGANTWRVIGSV